MTDPASPPRTKRKANPLRGLALAAVVVTVLGAAGSSWLHGPRLGDLPPAFDVAGISPARLRETVRTLAGLGPRTLRKPKAREAATSLLADGFREAGLSVEIDAVELKEGSFSNVIARRPGSDPSAGIVVVGAHLDTVFGSSGADDNASALAALLELARTLPEALGRRGLMLAAWDSCEPPFFGTADMGSFRHAQVLRDSGERVHLGVALYQVGYYSDEDGSQSWPMPGMNLTFPTRGDFLLVTGGPKSGEQLREAGRGLRSARSLPIETLRSPVSWPLLSQSDELSLRSVGIPSLLLTDTMGFRNPHSHGDDDLPGTLDYERLADVVKALHGLLRETEALPTAP
jgi:hypothetical protein